MPFTLSIIFFSIFSNWTMKTRSASKENTHSGCPFANFPGGELEERSARETQKQTLLKACLSSILLPLVSWPSARLARRARLHAATSNLLKSCILCQTESRGGERLRQQGLRELCTSPGGDQAVSKFHTVLSWMMRAQKEGIGWRRAVCVCGDASRRACALQADGRPLLQQGWLYLFPQRK